MANRDIYSNCFYRLAQCNCASVGMCVCNEHGTRQSHNHTLPPAWIRQMDRLNPVQHVIRRDIHPVFLWKNVYYARKRHVCAARRRMHKFMAHKKLEWIWTFEERKKWSHWTQLNNGYGRFYLICQLRAFFHRKQWNCSIRAAQQAINRKHGPGKFHVAYAILRIMHSIHTHTHTLNCGTVQ